MCKKPGRAFVKAGNLMCKDDFMQKRALLHPISKRSYYEHNHAPLCGDAIRMPVL